MCGGRSSILHYGPLIETNYLYAPTLNKSNNTHLRPLYINNHSIMHMHQR